MMACVSPNAVEKTYLAILSSHLVSKLLPTVFMAAASLLYYNPSSPSWHGSGFPKHLDESAEP